MEKWESFIAQLRTEMSCLWTFMLVLGFQHAPVGVCCLRPPQSLGMKGSKCKMLIAHNEHSCFKIVPLI